MSPSDIRQQTWVFGYGSLVDPISLSRTLERTVIPGVDFLEAELAGWERRWNYGVGHVSARWCRNDGTTVDDGVIIALGVIAVLSARTNGIIARVSDVELARLDVRERDYDRVDVTADVVQATSKVDEGLFGEHERVVTYVPRPSAIARYEMARDSGTAGIRSTYWNLVEDAFAQLGDEQRRMYRESTPAPDVPVIDVISSRDR